MPKKSKQQSYIVSLTAAEWSALCICANHGATEMTAATALKAHDREMTETIVRYSDAAVKIIHSVLPHRAAAPAQSGDPSVDASDGTRGAGPQAE